MYISNSNININALSSSNRINMIYLFTVSLESITFTYSRLLSGDYFYEDNTIYIFDVHNAVYSRDISSFNIKELFVDIERPYIDISSKVYQDNIRNDEEAKLVINNSILNIILSNI